MADARVPTVTGPVSSGRGWIFGSPVVDVATYGYRLDEYFVEGDAFSYVLADGAEATLDGRWTVAPAEQATFRTRIYVAVPTEPTAFNGVVLVHWQNVTMGVDVGFPTPDQMARGFAWVGVTTQRVALEGQPSLAPDIPATSGLRAWDPARYGSLSHPGDAYSYDIFSQVVRYLRQGRGHDPDVLHGLEARLFVAVGASQSAMRLGSYINIAHQHDRVVDGFLLTVHWGLCPPPPDLSLVDSFQFTDQLRFAASAQIRDDGATPILVLTSESEALMMAMVRQPDSDTFRHWEMAGAAHAGGDLLASLGPIFIRDGIGTGLPEAPQRNQVVWDYVEHAALARLIEWVDGPPPPASIPPIELDPTRPGTFRTDSVGNALGGVRLPEVMAPLGVHSGTNDLGGAMALSGRTVPLSSEQILELYPDPTAFLEAWDAAVEDLLALGLLLADEVDDVKARGRAGAATVEEGAVKP